MKKTLIIAFTLFSANVLFAQQKFVVKVQGTPGISKADSVNGYVTPSQLAQKLDTSHHDITNVFAPIYSVNVNDSTHELHVHLITDTTLSGASDTSLVSSLAVKKGLDAKANDTSVLHKSGVEAVIGLKLFNGNLGVRGLQPVPSEDVGLWSTVKGIGGSGGVLRAGQFYSNYTGTNAFVAGDFYATDSGSTSNYDHVVSMQGFTNHLGSGTINNAWGAKMSGNNSGGNIANAYGYYFGGWGGSGTYTHKYAFYSAGTDQSSLNGPLSVNGKFAFGVSDVLGSYQGLFNGIDPLYEYQNSGVTTVFMGTGSILFSGLNGNDFGVMQNNASRAIAFGVNGTLGIKIEKALSTFNTNSLFNDSVKVNGHIGVRNSQPVAAEDVGLWSNVSGAGGSNGVLRAGQFWTNYTGVNAATGVDVQISDSSSSSNSDHLVGTQSNLIHAGSGTVSNLFTYKGVGSNNGGVTNAYGYYWGGWTGAGTYGKKWAFYNADTDPSSLNGPLSVNGKFAFGVSDTLGAYAGLFNAIDPIYEYQNNGVTMAYVGSGSVTFGQNNNDFAIMQNDGSRSLLFGVNAALGLRIQKTLSTFNTDLSIATMKDSSGNFITRNTTTGILNQRTYSEVRTDLGFASGTATLASGTVTVSTAAVKTGAVIFLSYNTPSGTQGFLSAPAASIVNATSFVINSSSASDNSTVYWKIINP